MFKNTAEQTAASQTGIAKSFYVVSYRKTDSQKIVCLW